MSRKISHAEFNRLTARKTPCLITIDYPENYLNKEINLTLDRLCLEFPYVLC